uniref:kinesin-like protein KIF23 isoform X1 n=1 Tax=Ciona intestinalis TaxID=7719 RepID=UPI00006A7708|nr:kinesin-like protein KIF23 isoform X1 [Ciona intestinalis]|eukprot:XP_002124655.2 kinesin-like protein KIF23 isoform X1 [Ciona intestinalis]
MKPQRKLPRKFNSQLSNAQTDPVEVFARIRNKTVDNQDACIQVINDTTIHLVGANADSKVTECQFSRVFAAEVSQKLLFDSVAQSMVDDLIRGKNGLLFTYGVTSSGKTYTMTGSLEEPGFLPRCLDMLFNSTKPVQASKYVFVPDGMNGFCVQSEAEALLEKQEREILPQLTPKNASRMRHRNVDLRYDLEHCQSENVNPECRYSVFVSYVEIYNDYVYDLLGEVQLDPFQRPKPPQSKRLREDKKKNMFVYGVSQIEVTSTEEAFAVFQQGQERRRIAHTQLNAESSRSHSILNIRLVQAPLDPLGEDLLQEKSLICASQLSLVDLAGSERMTRTGAGGERLREAGNINSSLMTLRRCLEQLRENQKGGGNEMIKYRNSKLTHLFKSYFEGHGTVKMVVCLNPNMAEHDENLHVVQFAEMAQQVEVARSEDFRVDRESIKKKALEAKAKREEDRKKQLTAIQQLNQEANSHRLFKRTKYRSQIPSSDSDSAALTPATTTDDGESDWEATDYCLGPSFPNLEVVDSADNRTIPFLISMLENRIENMSSIKRSAKHFGSLFRTNLNAGSQHDQELQQKLRDCENDLGLKGKEVNKMERQVKKLESKNQVLTRTTQVFEKEKKQLQEQLSEAESQLKSSLSDTRRLESKIKGAVANTKAHVEKECDKRVRSVQAEMQEKMWVKDERLRQLKNIISTGREGRPTTRRCQTPLKQPISSAESTSSSSHLSRKRRSRSAENLLSTHKHKNVNSSIHSSRKQLSSTSVGIEGNSLRDIESRAHRMTTRSKTKEHSVCSEDESHLLEQENPRTLGCQFVNRENEDKMRHRPGAPIAPKHRRSCSNNPNWLAHLPSSTIQTETILQPAIRPNRVVNVPSPKDVAGASKYLLTHQSEDKDGEIETQLVKGEVFHTRSGGQQVQFVDIETLKQHDPKKNKKNTQQQRKRRSTTSVDEVSADEQSSWTDVETRCAYGIGNNTGVVASSKRKK